MKDRAHWVSRSLGREGQAKDLVSLPRAQNVSKGIFDLLKHRDGYARYLYLLLHCLEISTLVKR